MHDWSGKHVDIYFKHDAPKLHGIFRRAEDSGIVIDTGDDGTAISFKVGATFIPYAAIRHMNVLEPRSADEQEAKKKDLAERFRRTQLEQAAAPNLKTLELLEKQID